MHAKSDNVRYSTQNNISIQAGTNRFIPFEFRGEPKEYFRIWIVNVMLTILTLGIYSAWAKVRTNRYIFANTYLNGSNFEYNAQPKKILYGRIIVVSVYGAFYLLNNVFDLFSVALWIVGIFLLAFPWLVRQTFKFKLKYTSYRNINFSYRGEVKKFYFVVLWALLPMIIMAGYGFFVGSSPADTNSSEDNMFGMFAVLTIIYILIAYPIIYRYYKAITINGSYYGRHRFEFHANKGSSYMLFAGILATSFMFSIIIGFLGVMFKVIVASMIGGAADTGGSDISMIVGSIAGIMVYLVSMGFYKGLNDGYFANYVRNNTTLGSAKIKGEIVPVSLGIISAKNVVMLLFSIGLMYPWTKFRYIKYKIENTFFYCEDFDKFVAGEKGDIFSLGEETLDFFDIDIGI